MAMVNNCNPNDTAVFTEIIYSARNVAYSTDTLGHTYLDFDLFASNTPNNLLFAQSNVFIQYNSLFGTNLVANGKITASKGNAIDSPYYNLALTDSTPTLLKIAITHTPNPSSLTNLDSANQQLCHLKLNLSGFNLSAIGAYFDTLAMANHSSYRRTPNGLEFPYNKILVSGLNAPQTNADSIFYQLVFDSISLGYYLQYRTPPDTIVFEVQASGSNCEYLYTAAPVITYSTNSLGNNICANSRISCTTSASSAYTWLQPGDIANNAFQIHLDADYPGNYDPFNAPDSIVQVCTFITIATCKVIVANNCAPVHFGIGSTSTGTYASLNFTDSTFIPQPFNVVPFAGFDTSTTLFSQAPTIDSFAPATIPAGTFDTLTIYGRGFGCTPGRIFFTGVQGGTGNYIEAQPQDFISWADNQIKIIVASCINSYKDLYIPGTGPIQLTNSSNITCVSTASLFIPYAVMNDRLSNGKAIRVGLTGYNNDYTFIPDATVTANPPALTTITHAMNDWVCETGVRFTMGAPVDTAISPKADLISSVSFGTPPINEADGYAYNRVTNPRINSHGDSIEVLTESDILFDQTLLNQFIPYPWYLDTNAIPSPLSPALGYVSLLGIARHEFGHAHGLRHVLNSSYLMYPTTPVDICKVIHTDDRDGGLYELLNAGALLAPYFSANPQSFPSGCPYATPNSITQVGNSNLISIYPNPFDQTVTISMDLNNNSYVNVKMLDVLGRVVIDNDYGNSTGTHFERTVYTGTLSTGIYIIEITVNNAATSFKLIKN